MFGLLQQSMEFNQPIQGVNVGTSDCKCYTQSNLCSTLAFLFIAAKPYSSRATVFSSCAALDKIAPPAEGPCLLLKVVKRLL